MPAVHRTHLVGDTALLYEPAGHSSHSLNPSAFEYQPDGHVEHRFSPCRENFPEAHFAQLPPSSYFPASQVKIACVRRRASATCGIVFSISFFCRSLVETLLLISVLLPLRHTMKLHVITANILMAGCERVYRLDKISILCPSLIFYAGGWGKERVGRWSTRIFYEVAQGARIISILHPEKSQHVERRKETTSTWYLW